MNQYQGNLIAAPGVIYDYTAITGGLYASGADTRAAFPKLTTVGGGLYASGADTRTAFPRLTTVGGRLYASGADTRAAFPKLTTVGGWLDVRGADTRAAFPKLTTVGGGLYASGADTRAAFPKLTTVGGTLDASGADTRAAFPALAHTDDPDAARRAFLSAGYTWDDGILSEIISRRGHVMRVRVVGQTSISYVVTDGTHTAHGRTLAEARADLRLKQGPRDTTPYAAWTLDTVVTQEEAIAAYRAVTGACGAGVSAFLASRRIPARLPVRRIVEETQGAYGHAAFTAFVRRHDKAADAVAS